MRLLPGHLPLRDLFKDPDSGLPLRCDMCEGEDEPWCVKWCLNDVLTYEEREEEVDEEEKPSRTWISGWRPWPTSSAWTRWPDAVARLSQKKA